MKTKIFKIAKLGLLILFLLFSGKSYTQDTTKQSQILDLKIQLFDAKLQLLDFKINTLSSKSEELYLNFLQLDSAIKLKIDSLTYMLDVQQTLKHTDTIQLIPVKPYKSVIKLSPNRLLEGSFLLSYERVLKDNFSIDIACMLTYLTKKGLGGEYLGKQNLYAYSSETNSYYQYEGKMLSGWGIIFQARNYLLPKINSNYKAPIGLYAAVQLMYRDLLITGTSEELQDTVWVDKETKQNLDILAGGVLLGCNFEINKVISIDIYAGGVMRLSKYYREPNITKYKQWNNIDYSGVLPTAGINIGILK
jgi:hypothetical protein